MTAIKETEDVRAIKALIQAFFDRINASDPGGLQKLFVPGANLTIARQDPARDPPPDSTWGTLQLPQPAIHRSSSSSDESISVVLRLSIEEFVRLLEDGEKRRKGKPGPTVHEEPDLKATDVKVDHLFGTAWSPFWVTFDGTLHHYGSFVYTFGKVDDGEGGGSKVWRIEGLTQNYRRTEGWEEEKQELGKKNL